MVFLWPYAWACHCFETVLFSTCRKNTILTNYDFYYTFVIDAIRCVVAHIHLADDSYHVAVKYVILTNYVNICDSCYRGFSISDNIQYRHVWPSIHVISHMIFSRIVCCLQRPPARSVCVVSTDYPDYPTPIHHWVYQSPFFLVWIYDPEGERYSVWELSIHHYDCRMDDPVYQRLVYDLAPRPPKSARQIWTAVQKFLVMSYPRGETIARIIDEFCLDRYGRMSHNRMRHHLPFGLDPDIAPRSFLRHHTMVSEYRLARIPLPVTQQRQERSITNPLADLPPLVGMDHTATIPDIPLVHVRLRVGSLQPSVGAFPRHQANTLPLLRNCDARRSPQLWHPPLSH